MVRKKYTAGDQIKEITIKNPSSVVIARLDRIIAMTKTDPQPVKTRPEAAVYAIVNCKLKWL